MNRRIDWRAVAALVIALLLVAVVRLVVPSDQLTRIEVGPGADGWAHSRDGEGRLVDAILASRCEAGSFHLISTGELLVVTLEVSSRAATVTWSRAELHTPAGEVIWNHSAAGFPSVDPTNPGFVERVQLVFNTRKDAWRGATVVVGPQRSDGIVSLREEFVLPVPEPGKQATVTISDPVVSVR